MEHNTLFRYSNRDIELYRQARLLYKFKPSVGFLDGYSGVRYAVHRCQFGHTYIPYI